MRSLRSVATVCAVFGLVPALHAQDQPIRATVQGVAPPAEGVDLFIKSLKIRNGLRPVDQTPFKIEVTVGNNGTKHWAYTGEVLVSMTPGNIDRPGATPPQGRIVVGGKPTTPRRSGGTERAYDTKFGTEPKRIPGGIAPGGESRELWFQVRKSNGDTTLVLESGKYYTITASIRADGENHPGNNTATRVVRFEYRSSATPYFEPVFEPMRLGRAGTVTVNAPPR